jgi:hypothetical protein
MCGHHLVERIPRASASETVANLTSNRPKCEGTGESLQPNVIVSLPVEFFVATGAENVDVGFGLLAQPNLSALDRSDDTRGEVNGPAKDIALFDLEGTDMNAGP